MPDSDPDYSPPPDEIDVQERAGPANDRDKASWEGVYGAHFLDLDNDDSLQTQVEKLIARGRRKRYVHPTWISRYADAAGR